MAIFVDSFDAIDAGKPAQDSTTLDELYMDPPIEPIASPRKTQASDAIENPIERFTLDFIQSIAGFGGGVVDFVTDPIREAGKEGAYERNLTEMMTDLGSLDQSILEKALVAGQAAGVIPKRFDFPEFKRYLASHQYEKVEEIPFPEGHPAYDTPGAKTYTTRGVGEYVGRNPGSAIGTGISYAMPLLPIFRGSGRAVQRKTGGTMKDDRGIIIRLPKEDRFGKKDTIYEKAQRFVGTPFANNMKGATRAELGISGTLGLTGFMLGNKFYDDARVEGKSQAEAEQAMLVGDLLGTFSPLGFYVGLNVTKNALGPVYTNKIRPYLIVPRLYDKVKASDVAKRTKDVFEGKVARYQTDKDSNLGVIDRIKGKGRPANIAATVDPERFKSMSAEEIQQLAESGDEFAKLSIKKVGDKLRKLFDNQTNLVEFLEGVKLQSGFRMSADQSKTFLKESGVIDPQFNLLEMIGRDLDPTLRTLTRDLAAQSDESAKKLNDRILQNLFNVQLGLNNMIGDGINANFSALYDVSTNSFRPMFAKLDDEGTQLIEMTKKMFDEMPEVGTQTNLFKMGQTVQENLATGIKKWQEGMEQLANDLGINSNATVLDTAEFNKSISSLKNRLFAGQDPEKGFKAAKLPDSLTKLINLKPSELAEGFTFAEWKAAREAINNDLGKAINFGNKNHIKDLSAGLDLLDSMGNQFGQINKTFKDWNELYKRGKDFYQGTLYKLGQKSKGFIEEGGGEIPLYINKPEKIADAFITDVQSAKQFMSIPSFADDITMHQAIQSRFFDKMKNFIQDADGALNPEKFDIFIRQNSEIIETMPFLKNVVSDLESAAGNIVQRNSQLASRRAMVAENQMYGLIQNSLKREDPLTFIDDLSTSSPKQILQSKTELLDAAKEAGLDAIEVEKVFNKAFMSRFLSKVGGEDAAVFEKLSTGGVSAIDPDDYTVLAKGFKGLLGNPANAQTLNAALGKEHVADLYVLSDTIERLLQVPMQPRQVMDQSALATFAERLGVTPAMVSTRYLAVQEKRLGVPQAFAYIVGRAAQAHSQREIINLWARALDDPELAKYLITSVKPNATTATAKDIIQAQDNRLFKRARAYMFSNGAYFGEEPFVDEENQSAGVDPNFLEIASQPEYTESFAEGGEVTNPIAPVEKEAVDLSVIFNPELQMVPIASPQQPQQGGGQPAPTGQGGQPMDFGQLFPQDAIGGAIAQRAQPPMPQPPMPQQFKEGGLASILGKSSG